jgi:hypothetical protein
MALTVATGDDGKGDDFMVAILFLIYSCGGGLFLVRSLTRDRIHVYRACTVYAATVCVHDSIHSSYYFRSPVFFLRALDFPFTVPKTNSDCKPTYQQDTSTTERRLLRALSVPGKRVPVPGIE